MAVAQRSRPFGITLLAIFAAIAAIVNFIHALQLFNLLPTGLFGGDIDVEMLGETAHRLGAPLRAGRVDGRDPERIEKGDEGLALAAALAAERALGIHAPLEVGPLHGLSLIHI